MAPLSDMGRSAVVYAHRFGWPVFPLRKRDKIPLGNLVPNGVKQATTDVPTIESWWRKAPNANVALACGFGWFVVDVDPRSGGDDTLVSLESAHGKLPETVTGLTGGGGLHLLFRLPDGFGKLKGSIGEGIDIKGPGGYIVAPPSIHPSGKAYAWDAGNHPTEVGIADPPGWLVRLVQKREVVLGQATGPASQSFLARCFDVAGWLGASVDSTRIMARCPWVYEHSTDRDGRRTGDGTDTSTIIFAPSPEYPLGRFQCSHGHCTGRRGTTEALRELPVAAVRLVALEQPDLAEVAIHNLVKWSRKT